MKKLFIKLKRDFFAKKTKQATHLCLWMDIEMQRKINN